MKPLISALLLSGLVSLSLSVAAETRRVAMAELGDLDLAYERVTALDEVPGPAVQGRVTHRGSAMYRIELPRDTRRATFLVGNGAVVAAGEPFVILDGPEIHHLLLEYTTLETRFKAAKDRYERSRESYRQNALREDQWVAIVDAYLALQLEYEHMRHFQELVRAPEDDSETIILVAPIDGRIEYADNRGRLVAGTELAGFLAADALQLRAGVPAASSGDLVALALRDCRLAVTGVDRVAEGFFLTAWSEAVPAACDVALNATVSVRPLYRRAAFAVPRSAIFTHEGETQLLVRRDEALEAVAVSLLMPVDDGYAVTAADNLAGASVLVTSVSAVQGILLGLGSE